MRRQENVEQTLTEKKLHPLRENMKRKNHSQLGPKNIVNA
jgi:hypothetical protein